MNEAFRILDANVAHDRAEWEQIWAEWPEREVAAHPAYSELFAAPNERVLAATLATESGRIFYPFLLRVIPQNQFHETFYDVTTAYGYGGPSCFGEASAEVLADAFWSALDEWFVHERVVSEFIRFSLFSGADSWYPGSVVERQPNIVVPVDVDDDTLWRGFESKVRKNVKRARTSGVRIVVDSAGEALNEFLDVYHATMSRRHADEQFFYAPEFFEYIHQNLVGQFAYFHAYHDGAVISSELVLVSADTVYSYLGGTRVEAFPYRPNDLLKYEIIRWAREQGKKRFVLGGGVSPGDGIERYKRAFFPDGSLPFKTGQRILLPEVYRRLVDGSTAVRAGYFPEYRS